MNTYKVILQHEPPTMLVEADYYDVGTGGELDFWEETKTADVCIRTFSKAVWNEVELIKRDDQRS